MIKRFFDIIFSLIVLYFSLPIFVIFFFLIKLDSAGAVFFKQKRIGKNGKAFLIFKFRTMRAEKGPLLTTSKDNRITSLGRFLRRINFDELPQFWNIVKGQMSVVGPRPEIPEIVENFTEEQKKILNFKPGFTSYATLKCLNEEKILDDKNLMQQYYNEQLPLKIKYDLEYFYHNSNFLNDLLIILKTVGKTFWS
ncbi:MAG: sugar transferase [Candidatus Omnitrophica bacterium]|nr:sugar transferase [Candidatus Omnitrophota bacterium]